MLTQAQSVDCVLCIQVASDAGMRDTGRVRSRATLGGTPAQAARAMTRASARLGAMICADVHSTASASSALL